MQYKVLQAVDKERVLRPVVEAGLHDNIDKQYSDDKGDDMAETRSRRCPVQAA